MQETLNYGTKKKSVLYPKDLHTAHDRAAAQINVKKDKITCRNFALAYERINSFPNYSRDGLVIVYPSSLDDLAAEGTALCHCVANYAGRVAKKECIIVFVRRTDAPDKPYFTAEVKNGRIVQLRGFQNCEAPPEVQTFTYEWERRVLQAA